MEKRIDPNLILEEIKEQEQEQQNGKLKIFFGYAAGVGKTYAMLEAARAVLKSGVDVILGYIEPHTRPDTLNLCEGFEVLPTKEIDYNGIKLHEFDIDGALKRKPKLILVDEFAHSNAQGSRHGKRYQDIEELLKNGIDVYTTLNVQHIESLNDVLKSITGITVREKIPDSVFNLASEIEIIDIEPKDLLERLKSGKVYKERQANKAMNNFFTLENLTALREIALRRCADHVNTVSFKTKIKKHDDYFTSEHILVGISSSPSNAKIIRAAARMAEVLKGSFSAVFVENSEYTNLSSDNKERIKNNLHLAEQLGAQVEVLYSDNISYQIAEYAKKTGVSKIVVGRSQAVGSTFFKKQTLVEKLINYAPQIDIYIIPDSINSRFYIQNKFWKKPKKVLTDVLISVALLIVTTLIGLMFQHYGFEEANIIMVYVFGVLVTSIITYNRYTSVIVSILSVLVFNFFFTEPYYSLKAYDSGYPFTFFIMFLTAFLTSSLAFKLKKHAKKSTNMALRTKLLLDTNKALQQLNSKEEIMEVTALKLKELIRRDIVSYTVDGETLEEPKVYYFNEDSKENYCDEFEKTVALWVLKNNKHAGKTTNTLSNAKCLYLALRIGNEVFGVIGVGLKDRELDSFEKNIMLSILGEAALALDNEKNQREKEAAAIIAKNEQLRVNLLRSISHDLRTPLTSINGNASNFLTNGDSLSDSTKKALFQDIYDDSMWLINLVENLLSVTRLEENRLNLNLTTELISDVVDEALLHINRKKSEHQIIVNTDDDFLMAKMDARLIVQVIINIVDNAIKYTDVGSTIEINSYAEDAMAVVEIKDNGNGIKDDVKPRIFDMFYSGQNSIADSKRSLGLGLSLCKSIVTAHGGVITCLDNEPKGTIFRFTLEKGGDINA